MTVRIIQPTELPAAAQLRPRPAQLRVAAYCRVSTDTDEQKTSYEAQCRHYVTYIGEHPDWVLAGIFADEGISGTQARRRPEFQRMIAGCEAGHIDLVITKSISRFARNTLDCLNYIRRLKELGIPVIFEKESINTMEAAGEVLITILASLAQQESASISQNVKMGIRYVMREGRGRVNYTQFLGYTQGPTKGSLVIVPAEAEVVRHIYRAYLDGYSPAHIASNLEADAIPTPTGRTRWHPSTIASILRNEKYCGDLLLQKYFTQDYLTHKVVRNEGQLPQYFVEDHHDPIVPKEVFRRVQDERKRRSGLKNDPSKLRFGSRKALMGRLVCARCGRSLKRCVHAEDGRVEWQCCKRAATLRPGTQPQRPDGCELVPIDESLARTLVLRALNWLPTQRAVLEETHRRLLTCRIAYLDQQISSLEERLPPAGSAPAEPTSDQVPAQAWRTAPGHVLETLRDRRAELLNQEMQLRLALDLVAQMEAHGATPPTPCADQAPAAAPAPAAATTPSPACSDSEDFYARTCHRVPAHILGDDGRIVAFDDSFVIRYLDRITVFDECCEVVFKANARVRIARTDTLAHG